jgi:gp16 family phage-associated protein
MTDSSDRCNEIKGYFEAHGRAIGEWADLRGFKRSLVYAVLNGRALGRRGRSHHIAMALGLKKDPQMPVTPDLREFFAMTGDASAHPMAGGADKTIPRKEAV